MKTVVVATKQQVSGDLGEESVILSLQDGVYYGVNTVGTRIWAEIQQPRSMQELTATLSEEFDVDSETCMRDITSFIQQLADKGLVEIRDPAKAS